MAPPGTDAKASGLGFLGKMLVVVGVLSFALAGWFVYKWVVGSGGAERAVDLGGTGIVFDKPTGWRSGAITDAAAANQLEGLGLEDEFDWEFYTRDGSELAVMGLELPPEAKAFLSQGVPEFDSTESFGVDLPLMDQRSYDHTLGPALEVSVGGGGTQVMMLMIVHDGYLVAALIGNIDRPMSAEDLDDYDALVASLRRKGTPSSGELDERIEERIQDRVPDSVAEVEDSRSA